MADVKAPQAAAGQPAQKEPAAQKEPVSRLPNQAEGNPGVQGWVHRPHQEKNPGETGAAAREPETFQQRVQQSQEARDRQAAARRARGETEPEGPERLGVSVAIQANSVIDADKGAAIAQAADGLVAALRAAGIEGKADVSVWPA